MKIGKQARRDAKALFQVCRINGRLDEERVRGTVAAVVKRRPRGYLSILQHLQRLVKLDLERRSARIESAVPLTDEFAASIRANLVRRHGEGLRFASVVNPALLGGLRIKVGSDVYDGSVAARLAALEASF